ncbi:FMN reductase/FAD reductase [NAD(P)H] [Cytobacillus eiseniae]|uniref:FMN reductase/FAD reductase [NAD(P)H] n=1 Tax=Cytobacillus eiseniae TaxID=762947 RepID=A0ABS4R9P6_9BACI|nr:NAD(P)H-dependent oxidoreductase [Cytobacillus eiseniae]MBP2239615.1 FMN reductase/FAD reductase [NAD(P)H] [Cytobacillus eiseniae]
MKMLGISGTILGAKTAILVEAVLKRAKEKNPEIEIELLDLRDYQIEFCDGRNPELYNEDTKKMIQKITDAELYLVGFPIFNGSFPAPLKNIFDIVHPAVFRHKVMGFVANGGTYQHYLVVENQVKPIAGYLRSFVAPSYVYANGAHFNEANEIVDEDVLARIEALADELVIMQKGLTIKKSE